MILSELHKKHPVLTSWVVIHIAVFALWLWARQGTLTHVELSVSSTDVTISVNGAPVKGEFPLADLSRGRIGLMLRDKTPVWHPIAPSWDNLVIRDLKTDRVLLEEKFDDADLKCWDIRRGEAEVRHGELFMEGGTMMILKDGNHENTKIEADFRNGTRGVIIFCFSSGGNYYYVDFRPYGGPDMYVGAVINGKNKRLSGVLHFMLPWHHWLREIAMKYIRSYVYVGGWLLSALFLGALLWVWRFVFGKRPAGKEEPAVKPAVKSGGAPGMRRIILVYGFFFILTVVTTGYLTVFVLEAIPHVQDSVITLFQAKTFASGHLYLPEPPAPKAFKFFIMKMMNGRWFSPYMFAHSLFMAIGVLLGAPWIIPPICCGVTVVALLAAGRRVAGWSCGIVAASLALSSPFFLGLGSSFMSHTSAIMTQSLALLFFIRTFQERKIRNPILFGLFLGLLFNNRPIPAMVSGVIYGVFVLSGIRNGEWKRMKHAFWGLAGFGFMFLLYMGYNYGITDNPLLSPYEYSWKMTGAKRLNTPIPMVMRNHNTLLRYLVFQFQNWPPWLNLSLMLIPVFFPKKSYWTVLLYIQFFFVSILVNLWPNPAVMYGPRYFFEAMPFFLILSGIGIACLGDKFAKIPKFGRIYAIYPGAFRVCMSGIVLALCMMSAWIFYTNGKYWGAKEYFIPKTVRELRGFNYSIPTIRDFIEKHKPKNALIFIEPGGGWVPYGNAIYLNSPSLDGPVVLCKKLDPATNRKVVEAFPGRELILVDYFKKKWMPFPEKDLIDASDARKQFFVETP